MRDDLGAALVTLARSAIGAEFGRPKSSAEHAELERLGATFVTLRMSDDLRGCIGTLEPVRNLRHDVQENARRAAFSDPRFPPLSQAELDAVDVEVSLLGASETMIFDDEDHLIAQLRPGVDGLILSYGLRRGTFLPQVWESLPEPQGFLRELKRKAGLPHDFWHRNLEVARYTVEKWTERDVAHLIAGAPPRAAV
jgi:AmmeMemoRadiSam system protein A